MENLEDIETLSESETDWVEKKLNPALDRLLRACPMCEEADLERKGHKDVCPKCRYVQPCCGG